MSGQECYFFFKMRNADERKEKRGKKEKGEKNENKTKNQRIYGQDKSKLTQ